MKKIFKFSIILLLALTASLFISCKEKEAPVEEAAAVSVENSKFGGTLVFARSGDSVGLDPGRETDGESFYGSTQVYDTLVEFVPGTTEVRPALAESWTFSDDGLTVTFNLRKGVKFHDGTDLTSEAVVFSFERQFKEDHPFYKNGPWKYWGYMDMDNIVADVIAVDDYTVEFKLKKKEAPFIANLAMDFAAIVSPAAAEKFGEDLASNPVGTGPFKFVSWIKDDNMVFERNPDYWGGDVYLDRLIIKVIPDATARWLALKKGEVDVVDFPSPEDLPEMQSTDGIKVIQQEGLNVGYLALNNEKAPYDNVKVRQAMNYAIDRDEIVTAVYGAAGKPAKNPLPPTMWSYNDDIDAYPYDPELAKKLLAEAVMPMDSTLRSGLCPLQDPTTPMVKRSQKLCRLSSQKSVSMSRLFPMSGEHIWTRQTWVSIRQPCWDGPVITVTPTTSSLFFFQPWLQRSLQEISPSGRMKSSLNSVFRPRRRWMLPREQSFT